MTLEENWFKIRRENSRIQVRMPLPINMMLSSASFLIILIIMFAASLVRFSPHKRKTDIIFIFAGILSLIVTIQLRSLYLFAIHRFKSFSFMITFDYLEWLVVGVSSALAMFVIARAGTIQAETNTVIMFMAINGMITSFLPKTISIDRKKQTFSIFIIGSLMTQKHWIRLPSKIIKVVLKEYEDPLGEPPIATFEIILLGENDQIVIIASGHFIQISWQKKLAKGIADFLGVPAEEQYSDGFIEKTDTL